MEHTYKNKNILKYNQLQCNLNLTNFSSVFIFNGNAYVLVKKFALTATNL